MLPPLGPRAEQLLRTLAPQVLGAVIRRFRDFAASEDAVQEALVAAAAQWPRDGAPENPRGWLIQVAARRMTDHVRSELARRRREAVVVSLVPPEMQIALPADLDETPAQDDTLVLLFMCCHPALSSSCAIAVAMVDGPAAGLALLETLDDDDRLSDHHRLSAVRAHLLEKAGDHEAAIAHYRAAADRTTSTPERHYLLTQAARLQEDPRP